MVVSKEDEAANLRTDVRSSQYNTLSYLTAAFSERMCQVASTEASGCTGVSDRSHRNLSHILLVMGSQAQEVF
jgi:hypothetical protein